MSAAINSTGIPSAGIPSAGIPSAGITVREARQRYFIESGFGADGNYEDKWAWFEAGPLTLPIPNTKGRKHAVRYHDLHHLLTGYQTNWQGEFEISGWEIGAGCGDSSFAWGINLSGLWAGLFTVPRRTAAAFYRGRHSQSLYRRDIESLLELPLDELQRQAGTNAPPPTPTAGDRLALLGWFTVATLVAIPQLAIMLSPLALLWWLAT